MPDHQHSNSSQLPAERLGYIEKKVDDLLGIQDSLERNVDLILIKLSGNEVDEGDTGLVGDVRDLKQRMFRLERWRDRVIYFFIGISFAAGWGVSDLINKLNPPEKIQPIIPKVEPPKTALFFL